MGDLPVADVGTAHVLQVLEPIWTKKPETASRIRGHIENIIDYAKTREWRAGENPARWKGHLDELLPARGKVRKVEHHAALPWRDAGTFMTELATQEGVAAMALRFAILTAARTGEVIGARWSEIDWDEAAWTIPARRMKAERMHRVPLSDPALDVLREVARLNTSEDAELFVFPGMKPGSALSNMALFMTLRRMKRGDLTVHGFRSSFRDWAAETGKPADMAEAALAHTVGDKTIQAYLRGDLFERRRRLMDDWAAFCSRPMPAEGSNVTKIRAAVA
jgi:integrase